MGLSSVTRKTQLCKPNFIEKSFLLDLKRCCAEIQHVTAGTDPSHQEICVTVLAVKEQPQYFNFYKAINLKIERNSCLQQS